MFGPLVITLAILSLSVALQSLVGFGLGMVSIPLLLWQGYSLEQSVFLGLSLSLFSSVIAAAQMKDQLPWRTSARASAFRLVGVVPGLVLARATAQLPTTTLKGLIGLVIGVGVLAQALKMLRPSHLMPEGTAPSRRLAPWAFLTSGVLTGWLGMGGPPLVFWQLTGRPRASQSRGFLFGVYLLTIPFQLALMLAAAPSQLSPLFPILALAAPTCWLVSRTVLRWGNKLSSRTLSWASLVFLALLALRSTADWVLL